MNTRNTDLATPATDLVLVEVMPEWIRASHEAAGYADVGSAGRWPYNGAERLEVSLDEAADLLDEHGRWARIVEPALCPASAPPLFLEREDFPF